MKNPPDASPPKIGGDLLAEIFQTTPDCIFFKDLDLRYVSVNPAMERLFNMPAEKLIGASDVELFGEEAGRKILETDRRILAGETLRSEDRKPVGGSYRTFRVIKQPVRDDAGAVVGLCGIAADVTDLKQAEETLRRNEERYRTLVEHVPIGLYRTTPAGRLLEANPAMVEMLGYSSFEEMTRIDLETELYARGYSREEFKKRLEAEEAIVGLEMPWLMRDGSIVHLRENVRVVRDADGRVLYYDGSVENVHDRVVMEQELWKILDRTKFALWGADLAAWDWNLPTDTMAFSQTLTDILGYQPEEMPRRRDALRQLIHPDDRAETEDCITRHLEGGAPVFESEFRLKSKSSGWRWLSARGKTVERDESGRPVRVAGVFRDISARKQTEVALREQQDLLHAVIEGTDDPVFVRDRAGRYILANSAFSAIYGVAPDDIIGTTNGERQPPELTEEIRRSDAAVIADGQKRLFERVITRHDGAVNTFLTMLFPRKRPDGEIIGVIGIARDISDRIRAEERLRRAHDELEERVQQRTAELAEAVTLLQDEIDERRQAVQQLAQRTRQLQSLADNSPDLISRVDRDLRYVFVNCRMAAMLGRDPDDVLGQQTSDLKFLTESDERRNRLIREVFETGAPREFEYSCGIPAGKRFYQVLLAPEFNDAELVDTVLETARDVTDYRNTQEQLNRTQRLASIGTLAAGIAHEINNPTGGILMAAQAALKEVDNREFVNQCLLGIAKDAKRCGQIVKSMLRFSQEQPTKKQPNNVNALIRQAASNMREIIRAHGGSLNLILDEDISDVNLNPTEFEQMLINLIRNAVEIGEHGACVTVRTKKTADCVRLTVRDDGPGMSPDQLSRIFDPFYTTRQQKGGMGLGLSVVHGIVEAHGGEITVDSAPNQGATFTIDLPF